MIVIGGMGSTAGAVIGAVWVIGLPAFFPDSTDHPAALVEPRPAASCCSTSPAGSCRSPTTLAARLYRWLERPPAAAREDGRRARPPPSVAPTQAGHRARAWPSQVTGVSVAFGGVKANDDVSIEVRNGEIVGLIGTNGAGKSTLMNAVGGFVPLHRQGRAARPRRSRARSPAQRARDGLGRTFQAATLFPELTVRETVEVALEARGRTGLLETTLFSPGRVRRERAKRSEAAELIDFLGLGRYADKPISELSTGTRRIVELAGLLALDARVLCLDEPTAGVAQRETEAMGAAARRGPPPARRVDAHHRARHAAHHGHERPRLLPRAGPGHRRGRARPRPQRPRRHRQLPRHRRAHHDAHHCDGPQRGRGAGLASTASLGSGGRRPSS